MDHFYTALEEREHPELKGKAIIVGADPKQGKGRGVVFTSNYEARKLGVRSGMPISRAWKQASLAIYLPPNFPLYEKVSQQIMDMLRSFSDKFEQWGIDEAFLDVTTKVKDYEEAEAYAKKVKQEISKTQRLTCSIGIAPNKLLAKIASDFEKPDGLTIVKEDKAEEFLAPMQVRKLLWVGKKTEAKLLEMGIKTIGDLAKYDASVLNDRFGVMGTVIHLMARGIDKSEVEERSKVKSISRELTFESDTTDSKTVLQGVDKLSEDVQRDVSERKLLFKNVTIKIRYENFETHTHGRMLASHTDRIQDLKKISRELVIDYLRPRRKIRLIGVRVSDFMSMKNQRTLVESFHDPIF